MATTVSTLSEALELYNDRYQSALSRNSKRDIERFQSNENQINSYFDIMTSAIAENNNNRADTALDAIVDILVAEGILLSDPPVLPLASGVYASPGVITVPVDKLGLNPVFTNSKSTIYIYQGGINQSSEYVITISSVTNVTATITDNVVQITGITADEGYVNLLCTRESFANLTFSIYVYKYYDAASGIAANAFPSSISVLADSDGSNPQLTNAISTFFVYEGGSNQTANWTFAVITQTNLTAVIQNSDEVKINTLTANEGSVVVRATRSGYSNLDITVQVNKINVPDPGMAIYAYPSNILVPTDSFGLNPVYTNAISTFTIREGFSNETANWTFSVIFQANVTAVIQNSDEVKINDLTDDQGYATIRATRSGYPNVEINIPVQRQKQGESGDASNSDELTISLNSTGKFILKRDQTGADNIFHLDAPDFSSFYTEYGTSDIEAYRLRSTNFRRVESKNDNGGYDTIDYTFNIAQAKNVLPYDSQGNVIIGPQNITEALTGTSNDAELVTPGLNGSTLAIVFPASSGDISADYPVSSKLLVYAELATGHVDNVGIDYYMSGTITSSSFVSFTVVNIDCDFTFTQSHYEYFADKTLNGDNIKVVVYTPFDSGFGSIGSFFNHVFGKGNQISGRDNNLFGVRNILTNSWGNIVIGNTWEINPTNEFFSNNFGNILIGNGFGWSGTANVLKGHKNLVIASADGNLLDHEDNNFNIIIGSNNIIGELSVPQSYGFIYSTAFGNYHRNLASASTTIGVGAKTTTNGQISFSCSRSEVMATKFIMEARTTSTNPTNIRLLGRTTGSLFTPLVSNIIMENSRSFTGTLDISGNQANGSGNYWREKYIFSFVVDSSGVITLKQNIILTDFTYNSDGFTGTISIDVATANTVQVIVTSSSSVATNWVAILEGTITDI